jgi:hypothetical protein
LPVLLGEITFIGPSAAGGWIIGWSDDPATWQPLTRAEIRGWLECHFPGYISNRQVDGFYDYLCSVAATCHAEAQCTAFCAKERALDDLNDLIDARFGGAA